MVGNADLPETVRRFFHAFDQVKIGLADRTIKLTPPAKFKLTSPSTDLLDRCYSPPDKPREVVGICKAIEDALDNVGTGPLAKFRRQICSGRPTAADETLDDVAALLKPIERRGIASGGTSEEATVPDPDPDLVRKLKGNSRDLVLYCWKRGNVSRGELRRGIWDKRKPKGRRKLSISDQGIDRAIEYCNQRLQYIGCKLTTFVGNGGLYCLQHPQK